ncbi:DNA adenine methylase [Amphibacillus sp. Q70]|uniref:DNA adenine methylase n=1 Tax=Amphibacillus sp. Q70 TaxID=3453416 RepID=UPI003F852E27
MTTTKEIEIKYDITRQTLHNWISEGTISLPPKDWRGWFDWKVKNEKEIQEILSKKVYKNNFQQPNLAIPTEKLNIHNRRYIGSKQKMLTFIDNIVKENTTDIKVVADIFGGTGSVANLFRKQGKRIILNDILYSNYLSFLTWFGNEEVNQKSIEDKISELNSIIPKKENYVSHHFGDKYFSLENATKIGAIREKIEEYNDLNKREKAFLLTSLLYAMDKVANTVGHYDAYRRKMDSLTPIQLKVPEMNNNNGNEIYKTDANLLVRKIKADLVYIDTPYNSRQYGDAYHLLENIMEWKKPEVEGVAKKMINRKHIKSNYNTAKAPEVFLDLIENIQSKYILVSYNNMAKKGSGRSNAKISNEEILKILKNRGKVSVFSTDFNVFTTGKTNIDNHKELLYLCEVK